MTAKGGRRLERIEVACAACGHVGILESQVLERHLDKPLTVRSVREVLDRFRCTGCRSQRVAVKDDRETMIYDADRCTSCPHCSLPRLLPELALHSAAALCPACEEERKFRPPPPRPMPPKGKDKCLRCEAATVIYERRGRWTPIHWVQPLPLMPMVLRSMTHHRAARGCVIALDAVDKGCDEAFARTSDPWLTPLFGCGNSGNATGSLAAG